MQSQAFSLDRPCRLVILISGRGSNMQSIFKSVAAAAQRAEIVAVLSNNPDAEGLAWAQAQGLAVETLSHRAFPNRIAFDQALQARIDAHRPDYVLLAGFMRILTEGFVQHFAGRLINIHPSLLPAFPGLNTHQQALDAGVQQHGCTIHFVTPTLDHGPIIAQGLVPVLADDNAESLGQRVLAVEHEVYPQVVNWLIEGRVQLEAGRVSVSGPVSRLYVDFSAASEADVPLRRQA